MKLLSSVSWLVKLAVFCFLVGFVSGVLVVNHVRPRADADATILMEHVVDLTCRTGRAG